MKRTTFEIAITSRPDNPDSQLHAVALLVAEVAGVENVEQTPASDGCVLHVLVAFADSKAARKVHASVIKVVSSFPTIRISGISTCMSDVFG